jgi:hypothetical protein
MLWSMTACSDPPDGDESTTTTTSGGLTGPPPVWDNWRLHVPVEEISLEQTQTYNAFKILEEGTFSLHMHIGMEMKLFRRGEDINIVMLGFRTSFISGGYLYELSFGRRMAFYSPATEEVVAEKLSEFQGYDNLVNIRSATLVGVGVEQYRYFPEAYFEEFIDENGDVLKAYFNPFNNELYGLFLNLEDRGMRDIMYNISSYVADDNFQPPEGFEVLPASER